MPIRRKYASISMTWFWSTEVSLLSLLAFAAGAAIALQAGMNARLGTLLKSSLLGTGVAFLCACLLTAVAVAICVKDYPGWSETRSVPFYLWFAGGTLSAMAVASFYYLIPQMGVGPMMSYALTGQILMAMLASHFGWFEQPVSVVDLRKAAGVMLLLSGVVLINGGGHVR